MQMVSKPNKIILESIAKAKGLSINEVKKDLEKNKKIKSHKRRRKAIDPTVELISNGKSRSVDFSQVKGSLKNFEPKDNVFEWSMKDVALYIRSKYNNRYNENWNHKILGACNELKLIHDRIIDLYGFCDFLVMRDYVDYIFENRLDRMIDNADGVFYLRNFRDDRHVSAFSEIYDYQDSVLRATSVKEEQKELEEEFSTSNKDIEEVFFLSEDLFVKNYGIVVCIFWLIKSQKYTNKEATVRVLSICKRLYNKGEFKLVKDRTELLSPYHKSIRFPKMKQFLNNIDSRYEMDIKYKENDIIKSKFKFLEEQE